ncbi:MAG: PP2C family protein-serine/threonine phosphatase [Candidatus Sumerlaeaceae bacterium]
MNSTTTAVRAMRGAVRAAGWCTVALGLLAVAGWLTGIRTLSGLNARFIPMAPNTAVAFIAVGFGLLLVLSAHRAARFATVGVAVLVGTIAALRLTEYVTGIGFGVDDLVFHAPGEYLGLAPVGRMAFFTALTLVITATSLFLLAAPRVGPANTVGGWLGTVAAFIGLCFLLGYVYGKPLIYGTSAIPMALNTAGCFVVTGCGLMLLAGSRDVEQRIAQRRALRNSEERTSLILETANDAFIATDDHGIVTGWNRQAEHILGWLRDEITGQSIEAVVPADSRAKMQAGLEQFRVTGEAQILNRQVEMMLLNRQGLEFPCEVTVWPVTADGERRLNAFVRDITARKKAEEKLAVQNAIIRDDLEFARKFQEALLPQEYPPVPDFNAPSEIALQFRHLYQPTLSLGGDFFHVVKLGENRAGIFIADVMGHGARSALVTAILRTVLQSLAQQIHDPAQLLEVLNRQYMDIVERGSQLIFATACYLVIDTAESQAICASAGHPAPLFAQASSGTVRELVSIELTGMALGIIREATYLNVERALSPGDRIVLFTDGVFEAHNDEFEQFGMERLLEVVEQFADNENSTLPGEILLEVNRFIGTTPLADDICIVEIEVLRKTAVPEPVQKTASAIAD